MPLTADDAVDSPNGTVTATITISSGSGSRVASSPHGSATVRVLDDDLPVVSITGGVAVTEGTTAEFTVTRVGDTTAGLTVMVEVTDGAGDFLTSGQVTPVAVIIMATEDTASLSVDTENDDGDEPNGMITATIQVSDSTYRLGTATGTVDIMDNDMVPPAPASLTAATTGTTSVRLTWTAVVANPAVTAYQVKVSTDAGGGDGRHGLVGHHQQRCHNGEPHCHGTLGLHRLHLRDPGPEHCGRRRGGDR